MGNIRIFVSSRNLIKVGFGLFAISGGICTKNTMSQLRKRAQFRGARASSLDSNPGYSNRSVWTAHGPSRCMTSNIEYVELNLEMYLEFSTLWGRQGIDYSSPPDPLRHLPYSRHLDFLSRAPAAPHHIVTPYNAHLVAIEGFIFACETLALALDLIQLLRSHSGSS